MRSKTLIPIAVAAALFPAWGATSVATAQGPVTIAAFNFKQRGQVLSFQRERGRNCARGWRAKRSLAVRVRARTARCGYRSPVVGDSSGTGADHQIAAVANIAPQTPANLRRAMYLSVTVRAARNAGYELRVFPGQRKAQIWRNPAGSEGPRMLRVVRGNFVRPGFGRNVLVLRAFSFGTAHTRVFARVNKRRVFQGVDRAANNPAGRRNEVGIGRGSRGGANGAVGVFHWVAISVPNPF